MRFVTAFFAAFAVLLVLAPGDAFAWGPGVHMVTGNWVLQNLTALPPVVAEALMRYPGFFLQGCLSADIFIGKGSVAKEGHSHNWESGFALLARATKPRDQAYAYGYLAHLAADTVAHNVFVPGCFDGAPGSGRLAHVYLEIQADALLSWDSADARGVFHQLGSRRAGRLLQESMHQKAHTFWLKKHVFEGSIMIGGSRLWRTSMRLFDRILPEHVRRQLLDQMLVFSTRAIVSVLTDMEKSPVLSLDPIGADALALAQSQRGGKSIVLRGVKGKLRNVFFRPGETVSPANSDPKDRGLTVPGNSVHNDLLQTDAIQASLLIEKLPEPSIVVPEILTSFPPVCVPEKGIHQ